MEEKKSNEGEIPLKYFEVETIEDTKSYTPAYISNRISLCPHVLFSFDVPYLEKNAPQFTTAPPFCLLCCPSVFKYVVALQWGSCLPASGRQGLRIGEGHLVGRSGFFFQVWL